MILIKHHLCTVHPVWAPKYSEQYNEKYGQHVVLLLKRRVDFGSAIQKVEFTKAKHLVGQRFAIRKSYVQKHDTGTNGAASVYIIPISHFEYWESAAEVAELVKLIKFEGD